MREDIKRRRALASFLRCEVIALAHQYNSENGQTMTVHEMTLYVEIMNKIKKHRNHVRNQQYLGASTNPLRNWGIGWRQL